MTDDVKVREYFLFVCPHCRGSVQVMHDQLCCHIFRHGALKTNGQQMNPHAPESECSQLERDHLIWGCGKPFRVVYDAGGVPMAVACDYI